MKASRFLGILAVTGIVGALLYMLIDSAISLDHSRSQNDLLRQKCELFARLADDGLRGQSIDSVKSLAGATVIAKLEDEKLWLDNIALQVKHSRVVRVDVAESCR